MKYGIEGFLLSKITRNTAPQRTPHPAASAPHDLPLHSGIMFFATLSLLAAWNT
jgi:hypothetical protein